LDPRLADTRFDQPHGPIIHFDPGIYALIPQRSHLPKDPATRGTWRATRPAMSKNLAPADPEALAAVGAVEAVAEETTAVTENRVRDKAWTTELGLKEFGEPDGVLCDRDGVVLATGYRRIVFGDHGPYMELTTAQVMWNNFPFFRHNDAKYAYFDKCISSGSEEVQLYLQKRTVSDKPNPPPGKYSVNNNRPEGYADYRPGMCYLRVDDVWRGKGTDVPAPSVRAVFTPARIRNVETGVWRMSRATRMDAKSEFRQS
jgi:hypothetical protein